MPHHKLSARAEHRQKENQRVLESPTLADKFPKLKSLKVELEYFTPDGANRSSHIKYSVNLSHAKSVFRFDCVNRECIRGDFDISEDLAKAVKKRAKVVNGEMRCDGWRNKDSVRKSRCRNLLRYTLSLGY
jgi:hypothetical protein